MRNQETRSQQYAIDKDFEKLLNQVNQSISDLEHDYITQYPEKSEEPVVFFCMAPRTGSTVISQVLSLTGEFSYITNFTARFWDAPYIAMNIEKKLAIRDLLFQDHNSILESNFGVTNHISEPHEFGFFWRKYLPTLDHNFLYYNDLTENQIEGLKQEITALLQVYKQPFFFKNAQIALNPDVLSQIFPNARFIIVKRDPFFIVQSLLKARRKRFNNELNWWSIKPSNYQKAIKDYPNSAIDQVIQQIMGIYNDITFATQNLTGKCLHIQYEDFCQAPVDWVKEIFNLINHEPQGNWDSYLPKNLPLNKKEYLPQKDTEAIKRKIQHNQQNLNSIL